MFTTEPRPPGSSAFSRPELIKLPQSPRCLPVLARTHQLGNLANVPQVVHGPFMQHLLKRDFSRYFVHGLPSAGTARQRAQELDVGLALLFEIVEGILGIGMAV